MNRSRTIGSRVGRSEHVGQHADDAAELRPPLIGKPLDGEELVLHNVPESDWKTFRELREVALQRFCERVLGEVVSITHDSSRSHYERYLALFRLMQRRDEQLADAFSDPARSRMIVQLATLYTLGLLVPHELERFSRETRSIVEALTEPSA